MIVFAGVILGEIPLSAMQDRIRLLQLYEKDLKRMKAELVTYGMSMPMLMEGLDRGDSSIFSYVSSEITRGGAMELSDAWHRYVQTNCGFMDDREFHAVYALGDVLGRYSIDEQAAAIDQGVVCLMQGIVETKDKLKRETKLYIGTSLSLSAMLVVLLL